MSAKHTPGPWIVATDGMSIIAVDDVVERPFLKVVDCVSGWDGMSYEEACANAQLIAAAPDLLGALRDLVMLAAQHPGQAMHDSVARARVAIAKAVQP